MNHKPIMIDQQGYVDIPEPAFGRPEVGALLDCLSASEAIDAFVQDETCQHRANCENPVCYADRIIECKEKIDDFMLQVRDGDRSPARELYGVVGGSMGDYTVTHRGKAVGPGWTKVDYWEGTFRGNAGTIDLLSTSRM